MTHSLPMFCLFFLLNSRNHNFHMDCGIIFNILIKIQIFINGLLSLNKEMFY